MLVEFMKYVTMKVNFGTYGCFVEVSFDFSLDPYTFLKIFIFLCFSIEAGSILMLTNANQMFFQNPIPCWSQDL